MMVYQSPSHLATGLTTPPAFYPFIILSEIRQMYGTKEVEEFVLILLVQRFKNLEAIELIWLIMKQYTCFP